MRLMERNQFDTIYHEHFSYLSLHDRRAGLRGARAAPLRRRGAPDHGGSLRIYACHADGCRASRRARACDALRERAGARASATSRPTSRFAEQVQETKRQLLEFLIDAKRAGKRIVGYGAPGKGNTLLNYCGIRTDFLDYTVDRNPYKQGKYLAGMRIPIYAPEKIRETRPDYLLILPWNISDEIMAQTAYIREWGGQWIVPIPGRRSALRRNRDEQRDATSSQTDLEYICGDLRRGVRRDGGQAPADRRRRRLPRLLPRAGGAALQPHAARATRSASPSTTTTSAACRTG